MPHIDAAMVASLRSSSGWLVRRSIVDDANSVKNTLSSWDNCMAAAYCKWPVIAAIIIAGLIVIGVVWCIIRCACCGLSCCCSCFSCLKCCGNCCGCCDPPSGRKHKHLDDQHYNPQQGYKAPNPMMSGAFAPPQYAQFETGPNGLAVEPKKVNEDALPPMPSWDTAAKKHVPLEEAESVELGELDPKTGQNVPLMTGAGPIGRSASPLNTPAHSPYGDLPPQTPQTVHMAGTNGAVTAGTGALGIGPRAAGAAPYNRQPSMDSRGGYSDRDNGFGSSGQPLSPNYGPEHDAGYSHSNQPYDDRNNYNNGAFGVIADGFSRGPRQRQYSNDSGLPYPPSQPQHQNSHDANRPLIGPGAQRSYSNEDTYNQNDDPYNRNEDIYNRGRISPPQSNNGGFDFGSTTVARGPAPSNYNRRPSPPSSQGGSYAPSLAPSYATRDPMPQQNSGRGYPSNRPYGAPSQARGPPGGRVPQQGRDDQAWNAV